MRWQPVAFVTLAVWGPATCHQARGDSEPPAELRVMSFNIRYGTAEDDENRWEKRRDLVFEVFRRHQPDVVGVQEALRFQLDGIRAALAIYSEVGVGRDDGRSQGEYSAILYRRDRFEIVEQGTFWLSETPGVPGSKSWGAACPRICTWAAMKDRASGRSFRVYNLHLDHVSQPSREQGVAQVLSHIRERKSSDPAIITGDFNAGEENGVIAAVTAAGWVDSYRVRHPRADGVGTFHAWTGSRAGSKIDYVFIPPGIEVLEAEILHDQRDGRYPSDHFPVTARVRLGRKP